MSYLVLDIETTGKQYDDLDETTKGYFRQWAERDAQSSEQVERELEQIKKGLPFSPFLGEVVAIGMQDDNNMGAVYFRADNDKKAKDFEEDGIQYRVGSEKEVLEKFWEVARNYYTFVTFNGRALPYAKSLSFGAEIRHTAHRPFRPAYLLWRGTPPSKAPFCYESI